MNAPSCSDATERPMKLRIQGNRIRLRLSRSEVDSIAAGRIVEERTMLRPVALVYRLSTSRDAAQPTVTHADGILEIAFPHAAAVAWAAGDDVGIEADLAGEDGAIPLLVEKDFRCLHGPQEDQADCYPNPLESDQSLAERGSLSPTRGIE